MSRVHSFPPIAQADAKVLILGSMPGKASLMVQQYYAHPRNAFWPLMSAILGLDANTSYEQRCLQLVGCGVAVWDVLQACTRTSSLDSDIVSSTAVTNDFLGFYQSYPSIRAVFFNGATAEKFYLKHVIQQLIVPYAKLPIKRLPSTSPAHAALTFDGKLAAWRDMIEHL